MTFYECETYSNGVIKSCPPPQSIMSSLNFSEYNAQNIKTLVYKKFKYLPDINKLQKKNKKPSIKPISSPRILIKNKKKKT